jgi:hypothetical protein
MFPRYSFLFLLLAITASTQLNPSEQPLGEVVASDASIQGGVILAATTASVLPGSTVDAGATAATIKLHRGGSVRVCPGSRISMNVTQPGQQQGLLLSLGTGSLEAEYSLDSSADTIITPDFRLFLAGPATFHVAVSVDAQGNTCVRTRGGNTGAILVTELMGVGAYQVKAGDAVSFAAGKISGAAPASEECGCPPQPATNTPALAQSPSPNEPAQTPAAVAVQPAPTVAASETQPAPPAKPNDVKVEVDAPFVFRAEPLPPDATAVAALRTSPPPEFAAPEVTPPAEKTTSVSSPPPAKTSHKGFFGKVRGFFAALFGGRAKS